MIAYRDYLWMIVLCIAFAIGIIFFTYYSEEQEWQNISREEELDRLHMLTMARTRLEDELSKSLFQESALAAYISVNPRIGTKDFNMFVRSLFQQKSPIIGLTVAPDLVVKYAFPPEKLKKVIGENLSKSSAHGESSFLARNTGQQVMDGPYHSVHLQKDIFIAREPVYLADENNGRPKGSFWGLVSVMIDTGALFKSARMRDNNYEFSLRASSAEGGREKIFFGNPAAFGNKNMILPISVPGGEWQMAATLIVRNEDLPREIKLIRLIGLVMLLVNITFFIFRVRYLKERSVGEKQLARALIEAEKANRAKSEFLANMSHELRTPLNAIIGFSDLIGSMPESEAAREKISEYARDINESGHHLLEIINQILDLSKVESGNFTTTIESVYLQDVVEQSLRLTRHSMVKGGIDVTVNISDDLQPILSDERMLRQIFLNLLSNAVKFTPKGGRITLSATERPDGATEIILTDTGIGMSEDGLRVAMQPFGQVGSYLVRAQQGTGLGLPLVKVFVELLGGRIDIQSEVGVGTEITLVFL